MRLPLWMGMLSVAGLACATATTLAQEANPGAKVPHIPPPPAVPAAPVGHVDPAAKKALEEASEAVKNLGPCTFTVKMGTEGLGNFAFESNMKVKLIRGKTKGTDSYQMIGDFKSPGGKEGDTKVHAAMLEGKTGEWIDDDPKVKTLFIRPTKGGPKSEVLTRTMTPSKAFDIVFLDPEPFKAELAAPDLTMEKDATVNGEECQVVKATLQGGSAYRLVYISALDRLPRKYEQFMGKPDQKQQIRRFEIKDLTDAKLTVEDLRLKAPDGYKTDKVDAPPPPPPAPVAPSSKEDPSVKGKTDPANEKEREKEKEKEKSKEKNKEAEKERAKEKVAPDGGIVPPTTVKPGNN
jgi:hypothetical protein